MDEASSSNSQQRLTRASSLGRCADSMYFTMISIKSDTVGGCSVSFVPEQLQKSKVEAYMPQVVSIGPLHKGTKRDLLYMEETKWRCMTYLLLRTKKDEAGMFFLMTMCIEALSRADDMVRACYNTYEIKFDRRELAKIMVLDGCFLLELLICGSPELDERLRWTLDEPSPGAEVIKREKVLSDLTMMENQIPLIVLKRISGILFPEIFTDGGTDKLIQNLALSILGYNAPDSDFKASHLLEFVHQDLKSSISSGEVPNTRHGKQNLQRCATRLEAAGVTIGPPQAQSENANMEAGVTAEPAEAQSEVTTQPSEALSEAANMEDGVTDKPPKAQSEVTTQSPEALSKAANMEVVVNVRPRVAAETRFDLKVTFSDGKLEIPQLHITETTEAKWRNFIAWELKRTTLEKQRGVRNEDRISCQFISYALFFQSLTCSVHDVKLLRDRNVIVVHKLMSDEDLLNLFHNIIEGVPDAEIEMDSWFAQVIENLNSHPTTVDRVTTTSKIMWHIFICFLTWSWYQCRGTYRGLRRVYFPSGWKLIALLAAALGLGLTIAQTVFSALGQ